MRVAFSDRAKSVQRDRPRRARVFRSRFAAFRLVLFLAAGAFTNAQATVIWIDTDPSIGSPIREVDDAFALLLAFHSPEIRIAGISTTYGNASLGATTRVARNMAQLFGGLAGLTSGNVFAGAGSAADLGKRNAASDALAARLQKGKLTYVALGPLTNLATFLQLHPDLAHRIERVIFLGGQAEGSSLAFGPARSFHIHDANVFKNPAAPSVVLRSRIPLTLVPIAVASDLLIDASDLRKLEQSGAAGNYLSRRSGIWLWFWTHVVRTKGGPIFDALALTATTKPELLSIENRCAGMDRAGNLVVTRRMTNGARTVRYCTGFAPSVKGLVMKRLLAQRRD